MENTPKANVTAKDFFLWLGAMVGLYVSTASLIILVHQYIQILLPDPGLEPYGTFYSGPIRSAIAALVVFFPAYVFLMRLVHTDARRNPEKKTMWVRRWLVFLTLFVAGVAMAIDLVITVNTFLNGELSMRFGLKALSVLAVLAVVFWYYLEEFRGRWEEHESQSKLVGGVIALVVIAALVGGFVVAGSPMAERLYRIDDQRVNDLSSLQYQLTYYWQAKQKLPATLDDLQDPLTGFSVPTDPETGAPYEYTVSGKLGFELCATFAKETRQAMNATRPAAPYGESWQHEAGRTCFPRTIDPELYPPLPKH